MKEEKDSKEISWEAVIIPTEPPETNPIVLEARSKGLSSKSIPNNEQEKCSYSSCEERGIVIIECFCLCPAHAKVFMQKLFDNPQNK